MFADDMIVYAKNPKDSTKKKKKRLKQGLKQVNKCGKRVGYKINIQHTMVFLYANNKLSEKGIKKTIPLTAVTTRIKRLRINLTKTAKDVDLKY